VVQPGVGLYGFGFSAAGGGDQEAPGPGLGLGGVGLGGVAFPRVPGAPGVGVGVGVGGFGGGLFATDPGPLAVAGGAAHLLGSSPASLAAHSLQQRMALLSASGPSQPEAGGLLAAARAGAGLGAAALPVGSPPMGGGGGGGGGSLSYAAMAKARSAGAAGAGAAPPPPPLPRAASKGFPQPVISGAAPPVGPASAPGPPRPGLPAPVRAPAPPPAPAAPGYGPSAQAVASAAASKLPLAAAISTVHGAGGGARRESPHTCVLKMRGLPFSARKDDIIAFFGQGERGAPAAALREDSIHIVLEASGRPAGIAFVEFAAAEEARAACLHRNRKMMGSRYVELFPSSREEATRVATGSIR